MPRGPLPRALEQHLDIVPMAADPVSSTEIRNRLIAKKELAGLLPDKILNYIRAHNLYQL